MVKLLTVIRRAADHNPRVGLQERLTNGLVLAALMVLLGNAKVILPGDAQDVQMSQTLPATVMLTATSDHTFPLEHVGHRHPLVLEKGLVSGYAIGRQLHMGVKGLTVM